MWFWAMVGVGIVAVLGVAGLYDRYLRHRGDRVRAAGEIEREIAKRGRWDGDGH